MPSVLVILLTIGVVVDAAVRVYLARRKRREQELAEREYRRMRVALEGLGMIAPSLALVPKLEPEKVRHLRVVPVVLAALGASAAWLGHQLRQRPVTAAITTAALAVAALVPLTSTPGLPPGAAPPPSAPSTTSPPAPPLASRTRSPAERVVSPSVSTTMEPAIVRSTQGPTLEPTVRPAPPPRPTVSIPAPGLPPAPPHGCTFRFGVGDLIHIRLTC